MTSLGKNARLAGLIYLVLILAAPIRLIYIPGELFVHDDAAATVANITAHEWLFRLGILSDVFTAAVSLFLTLALYRLFKEVNKNVAIMMLMLGFMDTPLYLFNVLNDSAALIIVRGNDILAAFDKPQRDALVALFLRMHGQAIVAAETFWGLWLFPLAALVFRSSFLPRFLGIWLGINGIGYLLLSVTGLLLPQFEGTVSNITVPAQLGEVAFMLWILVMGAKVRPVTSM
jgi:hypothetical protein